jgi:hypothetical protein
MELKIFCCCSLVSFPVWLRTYQHPCRWCYPRLAKETETCGQYTIYVVVVHKLCAWLHLSVNVYILNLKFQRKHEYWRLWAIYIPQRDATSNTKCRDMYWRSTFRPSRHPFLHYGGRDVFRHDLVLVTFQRVARSNKILNANTFKKQTSFTIFSWMLHKVNHTNILHS